jgi:hypothetical protein
MSVVTAISDIIVRRSEMTQRANSRQARCGCGFGLVRGLGRLGDNHEWRGSAIRLSVFEALLQHHRHYFDLYLVMRGSSMVPWTMSKASLTLRLGGNVSLRRFLSYHPL